MKMDKHVTTNFRLTLYFDINKTILIGDSATNAETRQMLNSLISEVAWGRIKNPQKPKDERSAEDWEIVSEVPSSDSPFPHDPNVMTFGEYLEFHTDLGKHDRAKLKRLFTEDGHMGEVYRKYFVEAESSLRTSNHSKRRIDSDPASHALPEYHLIVPSFFMMMEYLNELKVNGERVEYRLIFRTFGNDGYKIADEYNKFCDQMHHEFNPRSPMNGTDGSVNRKLQLPEASGQFSRTGPSNCNVSLSCIDNGVVTVVKGADKSYDLLERKLYRNSNPLYSMLIRDDFEYWHNCKESDDSGKLLLVDRLPDDLDVDNGSKSTNIQLFFDDNIERHRAHIVDARYHQTFERIPFERSKNVCLIKAEPFEAIRDVKYFANKVCEILTKYGVAVDPPQ